MDVRLLIAVIGGVVGLLGAIVGYTKFAAQAPLEARNAQLEGELKRREQELAQRDNAVKEKDAQIAQLRDEYSIALQDFMNYKGGRSGALIRREIDNEVALIRNAVGGTESSVLVPGPLPYSPTLVFLSIYGPAAARLRKTKLPIDKGIAGRVYRTGVAHNSHQPYDDAQFYPTVDRKGEHVTRTMLTVPIDHQGRVVGVLQVLNKHDQQHFTDADQRVALGGALSLGPKVVEFLNDPGNFETLGLSPSIAQGQVATVLVCDLTASSSMFDTMDPPNVIDTINEYLERQSDIALRFGATIDKYLGDGAMYAFNARRSVVDVDHARKAVKAAVAMQKDFEVLKRSWIELGMPLAAVYNRVGVACGSVLTPIMGHPQFQQVTVFGDTVGRAARLCEIAPRDRNVILIDESVMAEAGKDAATRPVTGVSGARAGEAMFEVDWQAASDLIERL